jgi:hypothetical protein
VSSASPASDAVPSLRVQVSPGVLQGFLVDHPAPKYPPEAKENHIQGKVVLALTIDKTGGYERYSHAHFPGSGAHVFRCRCREPLALPTVPVERFPYGSSIDCRSQLHTSVMRYSTRRVHEDLLWRKQAITLKAFFERKFAARDHSDGLFRELRR